jgi:hypothetical protein
MTEPKFEKITQEYEYSQTLERLAAIKEQARTLNQESRDLEGLCFDYHITKEYSRNRSIGYFEERIRVAHQEMKSLKSVYKGEEKEEIRCNCAGMPRPGVICAKVAVGLKNCSLDIGKCEHQVGDSK